MPIKAVSDRTFIVENKHDKPVYIKYENSAISSTILNRTWRVVSGETRKIHSGLAVPDQIIVPGSKAEFSIFPATDEFAATIAEDFSIAFKKEDSNEIERILIHVQKKKVNERHSKEDILIPVSDGKKTMCYLTGIVWGGYCWFISPTEEEDKLAREKAEKLKKPGTDVEVKYIGRT